MRNLTWFLAAALAALGVACGSSITTSQAALPTFSPPAGTYTSAQTVTLSSTTAGATIYYTTDGSTPTTSSTAYSTPISVSASETIKAIATASSYSASEVASAAYDINPNATPTATPAFTPAAGTYSSTQSVTISSATANASIYYTTDGSTPTTSSTPYTAAVSVASSETLKAVASASGYTLSAVGTAAYTITSQSSQAARPTFSPGGGTYSSTQSVTISSTTPGATLYYTTDGSTPTTSSTKYTGPVSVASSETINAIATASGYTTSPVGTAAYTINTSATQAATPVITPGTGSYSSAQTVTITCSTPSSTIYFTEDGSTPSATHGSVYSGSFQVNSTTTIMAIATATGYTASNVASATLTFGSGGGGTISQFCSSLESQITTFFTTCEDAPAADVSALFSLGVFSTTCSNYANGNGTYFTYNASSASTCLNALSTTSCSAFLQGGLNSSCNAAATPLRSVGQSCYSGLDCINSYCDVEDSGNCPGTCTAYIAAGATCGTTAVPCGPGYQCYFSGTSLTCTAEAASGASCASNPCTSGTYCDSQTSPPKCLPIPGNGGDCSHSLECLSGFVCVTSGTTATCQAVSYLAAGASCSTSSANPVCGAFTQCMGTPSVCTAYPVAGQACITGLPCLGSYCDTTNHCVALLPGGATCGSSAQCQSANCNTASTPHVCTYPSTGCAYP